MTKTLRAHYPAEWIGKRRVSRKPIKKEHRLSTKGYTDNNDFDVSHDDGNKYLSPTLLVHALKEGHSRIMCAQTSSRQIEISNNSGTNVKRIYINNAQPRGLSH